MHLKQGCTLIQRSTGAVRCVERQRRANESEEEINEGLNKT